MDFKTYRKNNDGKGSTENVTQDDLKKTAEKYSGKSDAEMLEEIAAAANKERREGTFSKEKLDQFASNLAPMLNAEQRERLEKAIKMIRGN